MRAVQSTSERERLLKVVGGEVSVCPESADIVDEHIQPWVGVENRDGEPAYLFLGCHVGGKRVDRRVA